MKYDRLSLISAPRAGADFGLRRSSLEYAINGRPLGELVDVGGFVCIFGCLGAAQDRSTARQLAQREPPRSSGRVVLYVCDQCGDLACGAVTVLVTRYPDGFGWSDFWKGHVDAVPPAEPDARYFYFEKDAYLAEVLRYD